MNYNCKWQSYSGSNTEDNLDFCGIATCSNMTFFIIADGSTDSYQGSELAQSLVVSLLEKFRSGPENPSAETVTSWCRATHAELRFHYPAASASYLIGIARENGTWITLHAGDCLLGTINHDGIIQWHAATHFSQCCWPCTSQGIDQISNSAFAHKKFPATNFYETRMQHIHVLYY